MCVAPGTKPAVGIHNGVAVTFLAIKDATPTEIALMPKRKLSLLITNKALLPKKHAEFRLYGEVQVPESELIDPVKGKARYIPFVILIGSTVLINDAIMGIAVDLAEEGVKAQLKGFPAWLSHPGLLFLVLTPRKDSLPYVHRMLVQCLETFLKNLDTIVDGCITTLDRANAKTGVHLELSTG